MKILIITEKPSVARDIGRVLKCSKKGDGFIYSDEYIISWAVGHLVALFNPDDYDKSLKTWKADTLPIIPEKIKLKPIKTTKKQFDILKKLMKSDKVSSLICATDSGREGELIFRYIYDLVACKKPFQRLWISSMTDGAIKEGFEKLQDGSKYDNLYLSAKCRSEADWLVGINATRSYTLRYNTLLTIGRVQTPTLAIIVDRQKEINDFIIQDYYEIKATFEDYEGTWFNPDDNNTKFNEKEKAEEVIQKCTDGTGIVFSIEVEEKKVLNPLLYDLTDLQRDCNKKFGYSAKDTLQVAQDLYEKRKMITYPRTDSRHLSDDMIGKINTTLSKIDKVENYKEFTSYILNLKKLPITKRIIDNTKITDHHAIIPTDVNINIQSLSEIEFKVYDLIVKRFLSAFYLPYRYNITRITTQVEDENFLTRGNTLVDLGWQILYKDDSKKDDVLPQINKDDEFDVTNLELETKRTQPPKTYTEGTLLSAMENAGRFVDDDELKEQLKNSGIGTAATRASIIERLIQISYITRKGKALIPTEKGMKLIEVVPKELKSPETTGKWEKGLESIAQGTMESERFMGSINKYVYFLVNDAKNSKTNVVFPAENTKGQKKFMKKNLGQCPSCKTGVILENTKAFYCSNWRQNCKLTIWKNVMEQYGYSLSKKIITELLKNNVVKQIEYTLPQTQEKCIGDLVFKDPKTGQVEIVNSSVTKN